MVLCGAVVLAALLAYYPDVADDFDLWWHLAYGRHFVTNLTWRIDHSIFSWTPADPNWAYVSWIGSTLIYLIHDFGGVPALHVLQWAVFLTVVGLFWRFVKATGHGITVTHLLALLLVGIALNPIAVYLKPELFTLLFFAGVVWIYFHCKLNFTSRLYWLYPPIFLLWVNTHGGFINGMAFISLALVAEMAGYFSGNALALSRPRLKRLALVVAFSYVAVLINPYGLNYLVQIVSGVAHGGSHMATVAAYFPVWDYIIPSQFIFRMVNTAWAMLIMAVWLILVICRGLRKHGHMDWPVVAINVIFFGLGMTIFRASICFCLLWLFSWQYLRTRQPTEIKHGQTIWPVVAITVISAMILWETLALNIYDSWFGNRIKNFIPEKEAAFVLRNQLPGPIFNDYLIGGYLIWALYPQYKVFIDSRWGPYVPMGVWDDYLSFDSSQRRDRLQKIESQYAFQTAIVHVSNHHGFVDLFLDAPDWQLIYFDKVAAVFVKSQWAKNHQDMIDGPNPEEFENITNPSILFGSFYLYCNYDLAGAKRIYEIYQRNVRLWFHYRNYHLSRMRAVLAASSARPSPHRD